MRLTTVLPWAAALLLLLTAPAQATVTVEGTGEPAFTNTTTNTQWFRITGNQAYDAYRVRYEWRVDDVAVTSQTINYPPNVNAAQRVDWSGIVATLQHGRKYAICAIGQFSFPNDALFFDDGQDDSCELAEGQQKRAHTVIDRTAPQASALLENGAETARQSALAVRIGYADALSPPFPANFYCAGAGAGACAPGAIFAPDTACATPVVAQALSTTFTCTRDYGQQPDGQVTFCAITTDSAVTDNPETPDQTRPATVANRSAPACDTILLDRVAPEVTVTASKTTVVVGEAVAFGAQAADATSGLSGAYTWTWGDGTPDGSGQAPSHAFADPGTYHVQVATADAAGNPASAQRTITVVRPDVPPEVTPTPTPSVTATPAATPSPTATPTPPAAGGLDVSVARRVRLTRRTRTLPVALTATGPGTVSLALVRAGRVVASSSGVQLQAGTRSVRLRLPRKPRRGTYRLRIVWSPAGGAPRRLSRTVVFRR